MVGFLVWILFGALVGWIASMIMRTDDQMGALGNIIVGIVGSLIGGTLYTLLTTGDFNFNFTNGFNVSSLLLSVLGAVILLGIVRLFSRRTATV